MTNTQMKIARTKICRHYGLQRLPTKEETIKEVEGLQRRQGDYDDSDGRLVASLSIGLHAIKF